MIYQCDGQIDGRSIAYSALSICHMLSHAKILEEYVPVVYASDYAVIYVHSLVVDLLNRIYYF